MLPAKINVSCFVNASSWAYKACSSSSAMIGPRPLISVSSSDAFYLNIDAGLNPFSKTDKAFTNAKCIELTHNFITCKASD